MSRIFCSTRSIIDWIEILSAFQYMDPQARIEGKCDTAVVRCSVDWLMLCVLCWVLTFCTLMYYTVYLIATYFYDPM